MMATLLVQIFLIGIGGCLIGTHGQINNCNDEITLTATETPSKLLFPSNGKPYDPNMNVCWKIEAAEGSIIQLEFLDMDIQRARDRCAYDSLTITDKHGSLRANREYCPYYLPSPVQTIGNTLYLNFKSDEIGEFGGFNLTFKSFGQKAGCTYAPLSSEGGYIINHVNLTSALEKNCWILGDSTNADHKVKLSIVKMNVKSTANVPVTIYDGDQVNRNKQLYSSNDDLEDQVITSTSGAMYIEFPTQGEYLVNIGYYFEPADKPCEFILASQMVPNPFFELRTPETPSPDMPQCWVVLADGEAYSIRIFLDVLRLGPGGGAGCVGSISLYDGYSESDPLLHTYDCNENSWNTKDFHTLGRAAFIDLRQSHKSYIGITALAVKYKSDIQRQGQ